MTIFPTKNFSTNGVLTTVPAYLYFGGMISYDSLATWIF